MSFRPEIVMRKSTELRPCKMNARTHSKKQITQIAGSIAAFGFTNPLLITDQDEVLAGNGRLAAALQLGLAEVPTIRISHLRPDQLRALVLADNKLALNAGWDRETLALELQGLIDAKFDIEITGFSPAEVDLTLDFVAEGVCDTIDDIDRIPSLHTTTITARGDLWILGRHKLICGDAQDPSVFELLLEKERADLLFTDPPYNVPITGHVCGTGRHREFAFASGEMSEQKFTQFLTTTLSNAAHYCRDGAIAFICMDWRHQLELLTAGRSAFHELKNLCVWNKTNGGMGTFYRSKHELVFVFKVGSSPHTNTFGLGNTGRYRTNVWDYPGVNAFGSSRDTELEMHPTVKPVALVADAIRDCSKRGEIILDAFGGSGTTLIAAQKTGRVARVIEFDQRYCDTILARFEKLTGQQGILASTGETFEEKELALSIERVAHK